MRLTQEEYELLEDRVEKMEEAGMNPLEAAWVKLWWDHADLLRYLDDITDELSVLMEPTE